MANSDKIIIIGAGFTGLSLAYDLALAGHKVLVLESMSNVGGLASTFEVEGERLEKFYHHWFTNDVHVMSLIRDLGKSDSVRFRDTRTGVYFGNKFFKLSRPIDLLRFKPLSLRGRLRLGLLAIRVRFVREWMRLETTSASDWLIKMAGEEVYRVVWAPLLRGKFGEAASEVSAVWMWNKLKLRGGSRGKKGGEQLAYYQGGFGRLLDDLVEGIKLHGGNVITDSKVTGVDVENGKVTGVHTENLSYLAENVVVTAPLPVIADMLAPHISDTSLQKLKRIKYLANICIVLELNRSLSETYWLNVNDPSFPFVAVIEHTNFEDKDLYGGRHIIYLSKYLPETAELFQMSDAEAVSYAVNNLKRMFPEFNLDWTLNASVWRGQYSQPIVEKNYSELIPEYETEVAGLYINTMAQIYPEDRGTNYAIRQGREMARRMCK
ncbi:MAG: amine oxidase [Woeseiaceae bacterium]|nr:amine oxidase [Woeseiaceae bacterium]|tara:strand:+ start:76 stop:1383 length:1308 start_codon:yes stop_codon:yes gene_type:complete